MIFVILRLQKEEKKNNLGPEKGMKERKENILHNNSGNSFYNFFKFCLIKVRTILFSMNFEKFFLKLIEYVFKISENVVSFADAETGKVVACFSLYCDLGCLRQIKNR